VAFPAGGNLNLEYADPGVVGLNPGFEYQGQEPNALYCETREINGAFYTTQNATWNKFAQAWTLVDVTRPAYGTQLTTAGVLQSLSSPSGTSPFSIWAVTGTIGQQSTDGIFNVKFYGAKGDGVTDDTLAIAAAAVAAGVKGGTVFFPPGTYICNQPAVPTSATNANYIFYRGSGIDVTILLGTLSSVDHVFGSGTNGGVSDMTIDGNAILTNALACGTGSNGSTRPVIDSLVIERVKARNIYTGAGRQGWSFIVEGDGVGAHFDIAVFSMTDCIIEKGHPQQDMASWTNIEACFINNLTLRNSGRSPNFYIVDKLFIDGLFVTGIPGFAAFVIDSPVNSAVVNNVQVDASCCQALIECVSAEFSNCVFGGAITSGCLYLGSSGFTGPMDYRFSNCSFVGAIFNQGGGSSPNLKATFTGCEFSSTVAGTAAYYGYFNAPIDHIYFNGCTFNTANMPYIISGNFAITMQYSGVSQCDIVGSVVPFVAAASVTIGAGVRFAGNYPPLQPVGKLSVQPSVPATTVAYTNNTGFDCTVYINAGAGGLSSVKVAGDFIGIAVPASGFISVSVAAGQAIILAYPSGSPTWVWFGN
jgi:hypothetical protein